MNLDYIEQSKEIYYSAESEYQQHYFDEDAGGFVLVHSEHNLNDSERFVAEVLAKMGKRVILLSERAAEGVKTPDADVDGEVCEFKELTEESKSLKNRVQEGISKSRKQGANVVVFHINREIYDVRKINDGITQALFWDTAQKIHKLVFVSNSARIQTITREEWKNGKHFQGF